MTTNSEETHRPICYSLIFADRSSRLTVYGVLSIDVPLVQNSQLLLHEEVTNGSMSIMVHFLNHRAPSAVFSR